MAQIIIMILFGISGICWSIVYIECIRKGFKQKTYCMPLFALALNLAWEGIYAFTDLFVRHTVGAQAIANTCWFVLDVVILITWFRFGKMEFSEEKQKYFIPWTFLAGGVAFALQFLFIYEFGAIKGEQYSAYLQNIIMSLMFIDRLDKEKSSRGQSMTIAVCKCVGTVAPTAYGTIEGNMFILVTGIICFVFDVIYIVCLKNVQKKEKL